MKSRVGTLKERNSFGENAVLYNGQRTASCVAVTNVICIAIGHTIFQKLLGEHVREFNNQKLQLLLGLKFFTGWQRTSISALMNFMYLRTFRQSDYVYKKGNRELIKNIYIVISGELEIIGSYDQNKEI